MAANAPTGEDARIWVGHIAAGREADHAQFLDWLNGDEAHGTCAMDSIVSPLPGGQVGGPPSVFYYYDRFRRVGGRWLFSYRKLSLYRPVLQLDDARGVEGV